MTLPHLSPPNVCVNHPNRADVAPCHHCRYAFCPQCMVDVAGQQLCITCKDQRLAQLQYGGYMPDPTLPLPQENWWALVSVGLALSALHSCAGIVTAPLAVVAGVVGLIQSNKSVTQHRRGVAIAGIALGGLLWVVAWGGLIWMLTAGLRR